MSSDIHALVGAWALDAVDDTERALVERHLAECESCAQEAAELRETVGRLADLTVAEPPPAMRERVLAEARRTRQEAPSDLVAETPAAATERPRRPWRMPRMRRALALAAAAVVIAFAGGAITWTAMQLSGESGTSEGEQIAAVLEAPDAEVAQQEAQGGGQVTVVSSEGLDRAVVVASDLAAIDKDRSYQLWLVEGTLPVSAGVLDPGASSATLLIDEIGDAGVLGVTNEPAGGSEAPTLPMVAGVELNS